MVATTKTSSTLRIGVGNEFRSDDRGGMFAARKMREKNFPGISIVESDGEAASLLDV